MANLDTMAMLASVDGILLVDKPARISSHDVLKAVKTQFNLAKIGHGGTLEPNATGLLVLLVGDATAVANDVMGGDRRYTATIRLGRTTNTQDAEGETLAESPLTRSRAKRWRPHCRSSAATFSRRRRRSASSSAPTCRTTASFRRTRRMRRRAWCMSTVLR